MNKKVYSEMLRMTAALVPRGAAVLDCAAGTGELSFAAAKKAKTVLCTDHSLPMLEKAREKAEKRGFSNISFERRDIYSLDDSDETYDAVIAGNVLHLIEEPEAAVVELYRVTKSGGVVILPCFTDIPQNVLIKLYKVLGFRQQTAFTPKSYVKMLREASGDTVKAKVIKGMVDCTFAVIFKNIY